MKNTQNHDQMHRVAAASMLVRPSPDRPGSSFLFDATSHIVIDPPRSLSRHFRAVRNSDRHCPQPAYGRVQDHRGAIAGQARLA
jgi:hypothetical protein